jgi:hypothetical protein
MRNVLVRIALFGCLTTLSSVILAIPYLTIQ